MENGGKKGHFSNIFTPFAPKTPLLPLRSLQTHTQYSEEAYEQQQFDRSVEYFSQNSWQATNLKPFVEHRQRAREAIVRLAQGIAAAHGLSASVTFTPGFPVTMCNGQAVDFGESVASAMFGEEAFQRLAHPIMGAEDFAYVLEAVPGAMFFLGAAHDGADWQGCCGIHSPRMVLDESVMPRGAAFLAGLAERFLAAGFYG